MIRVAHFVPYFSLQYGGPATVIIELTKQLIKYPVKTTIYASSEIDHFATQRTYLFQKLNPNFIVKRFNSYLRFRDYRINLGLFKTLLKDSKKIDIFHSHAFRSFQEDNAALIAKLKKKKLVITPHGALCANINYFQYLYKRIYDLTDTFLKNRFLDIDYIAISRVEIDFLRKFGISEDKIHLIPNGIDTNHFKASDPTSNIKKYNLQGKKIILYVGRINERKGIDVLVKAFSKLKDEFPNAYLLIAGDDSGYKKTIERLIKQLNIQTRVFFLGFILKKDLPEVYSMANVVVCPSKFEIFGLTILEANACEKPVIASNHWGPKELIINGKTGFLTRFGDFEELKEKIAYILSDDSQQKKMGIFAREYVKKNFSWEISAQKHYNLYKMLLEHHGN